MAAAVRSVAILLVVLAVVAFASTPASLVAAGGDLHHLRLGISMGRECLAGEEEEVELGESGSGEERRRVLAAGNDDNGYVSYFAAMLRDSVPCSRRGASYYNCLPGAPSSPYHRGCARITRCRG